MTAFARVITIGRNDELPRVVRVPVGVGVDGSTVYAPMRVEPDEIICPECHGAGDVNYTSIDPSVKDWSERCERCDGRGIVEIEQNAGEVMGRLSASPAGRTVARPSAVRPLSPGVTPVAVATADPSCFVQRPVTHTVKRSVPAPQVSHSPAGDLPPNAPPGALLERAIDAATTLAGLAVFAGIAWFALVLA